MLMKLTKCSQSGFARQIDRYLNSVWYPICLGALCAFSGLGDSSRYTICMGLIAVTVFLTVLFSKDLKPLFAPMLMAFCALGKDSSVSYGDQKGDVMLSYNDMAFSFVIALGILAVVALVIRFWKDGTLKDIWEKGGHFGWSILAMDIAFLCNGIFSEYWRPIDLAYGALMAFGFTFFYFICASIARRGENIAKFACQCMVCTAVLGCAQIGIVLWGHGLISFDIGILSTDHREYIELGWGIATSIPAYLVLGIPAAFYLAANYRYSIVNYLLAFAVFGVVVILGSRGSIIVGGIMLLGGIIICCFSKNKKSCRKFALAVFSIILLCLLLIHMFVKPLPELLEKVMEMARFDKLAKDGRFAIWQKGLEHFAQAPVFGVGFDEGAKIGRDVMHNVFANMYHNLFIQFLGAMGIVGILACGFHLWQFGRMWQKPTVSKVLLLMLPLTILMMSMVDNFFFYLNQQIAYGMFLAVAERKNQ